MSWVRSGVCTLAILAFFPLLNAMICSSPTYSRKINFIGMQMAHKLAYTTLSPLSPTLAPALSTTAALVSFAI